MNFIPYFFPVVRVYSRINFKSFNNKVSNKEILRGNCAFEIIKAFFFFDL
jgi:hypothetical protein